MKQQSIDIAVHQDDALQCLRHFIRRLGEQDELGKQLKPARLCCSEICRLPVTRLKGAQKPPF